MGDYQETLADASSRSHPGLGSCAGMIGTGRWKAAGGGHGCGDGQQGTVVPGVERAPARSGSYACGRWKPCQGPYLRRGYAQVVR
jgi:hypothetical protein